MKSWYLIALLWCTASAAEQPGCLAPQSWEAFAEGGWRLTLLTQTTEDLFLPALVPEAIDKKVAKTIDVDGLKADIADLKRIYQAHGYFKVAISPCLRVVSEGDKELALVLDIALGTRAYIRNIHFIGVKSIAHQAIEDVMLSRRQSAFSYLFSTLGYGAPQLEDDKTRILELYQRKGFLDARVLAIQVKAADDLSFCDLNIVVDEGAAYKVGKIEGDDWLKGVSLKEGEIFDLTTLSDEVEKNLVSFKEKGFAFAKATPELTLERDRLSAKYRLDRGERILIRKVVATGNAYSSGDLVTREFRDLEGKPYNYSQVEIRRLRLLTKGAFENAKTTLLATEIPAVYDLRVGVSEKFPMRFNAVPYYVSGEGFLLSAYVLHQNLFGRGVYGFAAAQISAVRQAFELAFYEPQLGGYNISWLTEVHHRHYQYDAFSSYSLGGGGRMNFRANDYFTFGLGFNIDEIKATSPFPRELTPYVLLPKENSARSAVYITSSVLPLAPSTDPNQLLAIDAKLTYSGPATLSEFGFTEISAGLRFGVTLSPFVLRGRISGAWLGRLSDSLLPITERYFLGGQSNLRGYQIFSVAPAIAGSSTAPALQIGGVKKFAQTIEFEFPLMKFLEMKGYLFSDMGNAYSETQSLLEGGVALSLGLGLTLTAWRLPIKCEVAKALIDMPGALPLDIYIGLSSVNW